MQGEHHDIAAEFPEFRQQIKNFSETDTNFASWIARHDEIDNQIREIEELGQPVADSTFETLKYERANLKDKIYTYLRTNHQ